MILAKASEISKQGLSDNTSGKPWPESHIVANAEEAKGLQA